MIAILRSTVAALVLIASTLVAEAQDWPSKPVRIVVAFAPGGTADLFGRLLATEMSTTFHQQFYVDNVPGSAGAIGSGQAARARPDGYTLLIGGAGPLLTGPAINANVGYDPLRDFAHVAMVAGEGYLLAAAATSDLGTFADVQRLGATRALTVGSPGAGSLGHLIIEQIKRKAAIELQHVPFRSAGESMTAILGGHVDLAIQTFSSTGEQLRAGKVVGLATTAGERVPAFKDTPTFAELGFHDITGVAWFWLAAPAGLPADIVSRLNAEVRRIVRLPETRQRFERDALITMDLDPAALTAVISREVGTWGALAREIGLRVK